MKRSPMRPHPPDRVGMKAALLEHGQCR
jgi:hypothetical protein